MKTLQNNFTTIEQSKMLLKLGVPADSADCIYVRFSKKNKFSRKFRENVLSENPYEHLYFYYPCWSVGRLMEIIAECYQVDIPFRYFVRGGMMDSLINTFIELREEFDFSKLEE